VAKLTLSGTYSLMVNDTDHLPENMDQEEVFDSLRSALQAAADAWYETNPGLSAEPQVF
jgi:hypothetical protein